MFKNSRNTKPHTNRYLQNVYINSKIVLYSTQHDDTIYYYNNQDSVHISNSFAIINKDETDEFMGLVKVLYNEGYKFTHNKLNLFDVKILLRSMKLKNIIGIINEKRQN